MTVTIGRRELMAALGGAAAAWAISARAAVGADAAAFRVDGGPGDISGLLPENQSP